MSRLGGGDAQGRDQLVACQEDNMQPIQNSYRVLFLCTGNSARSQMAEAVLNRKGKGRFQAESAGSSPAAGVNPYAIRALRESGIDWQGHPPRGLTGLDREPWDFVITVCDRAKEACPVFPGQPILSHWSMPDPAVVDGDEATKRAAFVEALTLISRRIDLLLALPMEKLERLIVEAKVHAIGEVGLFTSAVERGDSPS
jgi:arsenate reductase